MPGNVLLFHVLRQSTIGAERLDCRVRNGIGYYTFAIITRHEIYIKIFDNVKYYKFIKIYLSKLAISKLTISLIKDFMLCFGFHFKIFLAFEQSPFKESTSDGLKYLLSHSKMQISSI
jgi:hypothetical protein